MATSNVERNKAIMRSIVESNDARQFDAYLDVVSEDFVGHNHFVPGDLRGNKALSYFFYQTEAVAFPDGVHTIHHLYGEDDLVTLELSYTGTFVAPLPNGTPPNGQVCEFRYNMICRFENDKVAEIWWYPYDSYSLMKQLGMI